MPHSICAYVFSTSLLTVNSRSMLYAKQNEANKFVHVESVVGQIGLMHQIWLLNGTNENFLEAPSDFVLSSSIKYNRTHIK